MNSTRYCVCRTATLGIFVRSLIAPSAPQWRQMGSTARSYGCGGSSRRLGLERNATVYGALPWSREMHTFQARYSKVASTGDGVEEGEATTSATPTTEMTEETSPSKEKIEKERNYDTLESTADPDPIMQEANTIEPTTVTAPDTDKHRPQKDKTRAKTKGKGKKIKEPTTPKMTKNMRKRIQRKAEAEAAEGAAAEVGTDGVPVTASAVDNEASEAHGESKPELDEISEKGEEEFLLDARTQRRKEKKQRKLQEKKEAKERKRREANGQEQEKETVSSQVDPWKVQKRVLREKFPGGWQPRKKLSPDALEGIRALHRQFPETYTTEALAKHFEVSPEAVRRILKSQWQPSPEEEEERQTRWFERGKKVWERWAELGRQPPKRWQAEGIRRDKSWSGRRQRQMEWRKQQEQQGQQGQQRQQGEGRHWTDSAEQEGGDSTADSQGLGRGHSQGRRMRLLQAKAQRLAAASKADK